MLNAVAAGLIIGCLYGLMCIGLGLIFGIMKIVNFAQGELLMLGMYISLYLVGGFTAMGVLGPYVAPFVGALIAGPVAVRRRGAAAPLSADPCLRAVAPPRGWTRARSGQLIVTLGLSLILQNGGLILFGSTPQSIRTPLSARAFILGPFGGDAMLFLNQARVFACVVAIVIAVALWLVMERTRLGKALRAAADNPVAATYMGIDVDRAYRIAFGLGAAITAIAGGLMATYLSFTPFVGLDYVIIMYSGVVLGGMGSILGAFWGGLAGRVRAAGLRAGAVAATAERRDLCRLPADRRVAARGSFRPLGGTRMRARAHESGRRGAAAAGRHRSRRHRGTVRSGSRHGAQQLLPADPDAGADLGGAGAGLEPVLRHERAGLLRPCLVLRHRRLHRHAGAGLLGAHAVARHPARDGAGRIAAVLIGLPTFRLRGHYFALSMLAYPLAILYVLQYLGFQEVPLPMHREHPALFLQFANPLFSTLVALGFFVAAMVAGMLVENSRFGLALPGDQAERASGGGRRHRHAGAGRCARWSRAARCRRAAGGLYACVLLIVTPDSVFGVIVSAQALVVTLFGGVATVWGPVIGAAILIPLAETLNAKLGDIVPGIQGVVYGVAIIAIMLAAPEGLFWTIRDRFWRRPAAAPVITERAGRRWPCARRRAARCWR